MGPQLSRPFSQNDHQTLRVLNTKLPGRGTPDESNGYEEVASVFIGAIPDCGALTMCHRKRFKVFSFVARCVLRLRAALLDCVAHGRLERASIRLHL